MSRIEKRFAALGAAGKKAFIPFITGGDPDMQSCARLLAALPKAGADLIEIGMPFSDPMADGPAIEQANLRAFASGATLRKILGLVRDFRAHDDETPIVLMGYANPLYAYGLDKFAADARAAGVDGLIVADLPPEEDGELRAVAGGLDIIRLIAPTTGEARLETVLNGASGFLYYVAVAGVTGGKEADAAAVGAAVARIRKHTRLPVAVGFGIRMPQQAAAIAAVADAAVVGSALVARAGAAVEQKIDIVQHVIELAEALAKAVHNR